MAFEPPELPFPSCPLTPSPQQSIVPSVSRAQVNQPPALTWETPLSVPEPPIPTT